MDIAVYIIPFRHLLFPSINYQGTVFATEVIRTRNNERDTKVTLIKLE